MGNFQVGDKVVFRGTVRRLDGAMVMVEPPSSRRVNWLRAIELEHDIIPSPIAVRCDKCGFEQPLTDLPTLEVRRKALGLTDWARWWLKDGGAANFMRFCAELAEKGYTAEQFTEGLPGTIKEKE